MTFPPNYSRGPLGEFRIIYGDRDGHHLVAFVRPKSYAAGRVMLSEYRDGRLVHSELFRTWRQFRRYLRRGHIRAYLAAIESPGGVVQFNR